MTPGRLFFFAVLTPALVFKHVTLMAWSTGYCSPWLARNASRFCTVAWVLYSLFDWREERIIASVFDATCVYLGMSTWNRPKDDEGPRRRKRKKPVEKKEAGLDWTGASVPT